MGLRCRMVGEGGREGVYGLLFVSQEKNMIKVLVFLEVLDRPNTLGILFSFVCEFPHKFSAEAGGGGR